MQQDKGESEGCLERGVSSSRVGRALNQAMHWSHQQSLSCKGDNVFVQEGGGGGGVQTQLPAACADTSAWPAQIHHSTGKQEEDERGRCGVEVSECLAVHVNALPSTWTGTLSRVHDAARTTRHSMALQLLNTVE
jgi:hypothetical protein